MAIIFSGHRFTFWWCLLAKCHFKKFLFNWFILRNYSHRICWKCPEKLWHWIWTRRWFKNVHLKKIYFLEIERNVFFFAFSSHLKLKWLQITGEPSNKFCTTLKIKHLIVTNEFTVVYAEQRQKNKEEEKEEEERVFRRYNVVKCHCIWHAIHGLTSNRELLESPSDGIAIPFETLKVMTISICFLYTFKWWKVNKDKRRHYIGWQHISNHRNEILIPHSSAFILFPFTPPFLCTASLYLSHFCSGIDTAKWECSTTNGIGKNAFTCNESILVKAHFANLYAMNKCGMGEASSRAKYTIHIHLIAKPMPKEKPVEYDVHNFNAILKLIWKFTQAIELNESFIVYLVLRLSFFIRCFFRCTSLPQWALASLHPQWWWLRRQQRHKPKNKNATFFVVVVVLFFFRKKKYIRVWMKRFHLDGSCNVHTNLRNVDKTKRIRRIKYNAHKLSHSYDFNIMLAYSSQLFRR